MDTRTPLWRHPTGQAPIDDLSENCVSRAYMVSDKLTLRTMDELVWTSAALVRLIRAVSLKDPSSGAVRGVASGVVHLGVLLRWGSLTGSQGLQRVSQQALVMFGYLRPGGQRGQDGPQHPGLVGVGFPCSVDKEAHLAQSAELLGAKLDLTDPSVTCVKVSNTPDKAQEVADAVRGRCHHFSAASRPSGFGRLEVMRQGWRSLAGAP